MRFPHRVLSHRMAPLFALLCAFGWGFCPQPAWGEADAKKQDGETQANRNLSAIERPADLPPPQLDGDLSDPIWKKAARAVTFYDYLSSKPAPDQTEAFLIYDQNYLYIGCHCYDSQPDQIVGRETIRDADMEHDDTIRITLDPFFTRRFFDYAVFTVNPLGTRKTFLGGGRAGKVEWQGDWDASVKRVADGWTAEMRIPWAILPYPRKVGPMTMGLNFRRFQQRTKVESVWSDIGPQRFNDRDGQWAGVHAPVQSWKPRLSLLPYLMPSIQHEDGHSQIRAGLDARYQPTPEMTVVGTLNPDFASVEGAIESIGFSRSVRFVPDKRPFFIEGSNYLELGRPFELGRLFNSAQVQMMDTGIKVYGKLTPETTLGFMGTLSLRDEANYVTSLRREFGPTAGMNFLALQRLAPGQDNTVLAWSGNKRWEKWSLNGTAVKTAGRDAGGIGWTTALNLEDKNLFSSFRWRSVEANFLDRLGFIPFVDYQGFSNFTFWGTSWRKGFWRNFEFTFFPTFDWHQDGRPFRRQAGMNLRMETRSDYAIGLHLEGGKFDNDTDFTWGLDFGGGVSNRFRQWNLFFSTGKQANLPYTAFGPQISLRFFKRLDLALSSFIQNYQGISQQHILTLNYEISPYQSWGGRLVINNSDTNFYLAYRNAGRAGTDFYFIIGDPNAPRFVQRAMMKFVFAL